MTSEEKAYIAGIIDGEGSIMLLKFHHNQFPSPCISKNPRYFHRGFFAGVKTYHLSSSILSLDSFINILTA
ncbi:hypothetical protein [Clostridium algidicarnis]|uniref:hypothetical protein n=1 Tax=Clostridium algidicarnis TaxID=37659 RepID=UPI0004975A5E|nr:hypothetical protein [Clostridium algidicarnis]MBU3209659.1 hypothetical protein [Clostridium algidicarnis]